MASRGRGRAGAGHGKPPGRSHASGAGSAMPGGSKPKTPETVNDLDNYLNSLNESNFPSYGDLFADMVLDFSRRGKERLQEAVELIFTTTVQNRDYASLGARVCEKIGQERAGDSGEKREIRAEFRKQLFIQIQGSFKNRDSIRVQSIESWLAIFAFMCEISPRLKPNNKPFLPLCKAILSGVDFTFSQEDIVFDEIDCICSSLKICGKVVEEQCPEKFEEIFTELRKRLIFGKNGCQARCSILELIEFRYMKWSDQNNTLIDFYADAMADATAQDELEGGD